jgi:hypothetical protein
MPTLRESLLPVFATVARKIPEDLGLRTNTVKVRTRVWSGGDDGPGVGIGTATTTDLTITPKPKLTYRPDGTIETVVTPAYSGGGYTPEQVNPIIDPATTPGTEFVWVIISPDGVEREYTVETFNQRRAFGYYLTLSPLDRKKAY